jgi:hypothetical protein
MRPQIIKAADGEVYSGTLPDSLGGMAGEKQLKFVFSNA